MNEVDVRKVMRKFDFRVVEDQPRSVDEQIRLFQGASVVVGPHGAELTNMSGPTLAQLF